MSGTDPSSFVDAAKAVVPLICASAEEIQPAAAGGPRDFFDNPGEGRRVSLFSAQ